ncbi:MAG: GGDEF domain-containing protein [Spirochaetales bacterium]|nr:GGDEF domain-containing protein [Spirochaetales bacterium]
MSDYILSEKSALLKRTDLFSSLHSHELQVVARHSEFRFFPEDEMVFRSGDPGGTLYIVRAGEVLISKKEPFGPVIDIARFIEGNCFGELDMFTETEREVSAFATKPAELLVFPSRGISFTDILKNHPEISARILHKLMTGISRRIRGANTMVKENSPLIRELKKQVYRDKLTGIYNSTYLMEKIRKLSSSGGEKFALIISKPDNFKELNDLFGHDAGDQVIRIMARRLKEFVGDESRIVRYKGNALAVLLPSVSREEAYGKAVEMQSYIGSMDLNEISGADDFRLTASLGVSLFPDHFNDPDELVRVTHELPLIGRQRGGNKVLFPEDFHD